MSREVGGGASRNRGQQAAGLRQSPYSGRRVVPRPNHRRPLLAVTGRPMPHPIGDSAYVPVVRGVRGHSGQREAGLWDGRNALRQGEEEGAGPDQRGPIRQGQGDQGTF